MPDGAPAVSDGPDLLPVVATAVRAAWDSKAEDIRVIDITGRSSYADHIIVCSGLHPRHAAAIAQNVAERLKSEHKKRPLGSEGMDVGKWALLDYGDFIVHVFDRTQRGYYDLDGLWADAPRVSMEALGLDDIPDDGGMPPQPFSTDADDDLDD